MLCILIALYKHACNAISLSGHKKTLSEVGVGISAIPLWGALHCIALHGYGHGAGLYMAIELLGLAML